VWHTISISGVFERRVATRLRVSRHGTILTSLDSVQQLALNNPFSRSSPHTFISIPHPRLVALLHCLLLNLFIFYLMLMCTGTRRGIQMNVRVSVLGFPLFFIVFLFVLIPFQSNFLPKSLSPSLFSHLATTTTHSPRSRVRTTNDEEHEWFCLAYGQFFGTIHSFRHRTRGWRRTPLVGSFLQMPLLRAVDLLQSNSHLPDDAQIIDVIPLPTNTAHTPVAQEDLRLLGSQPNSPSDHSQFQLAP